jgi:hypothetical protein
MGFAKSIVINDEWQNAGINYALQNIADRLSCQEIIQALS